LGSLFGKLLRLGRFESWSGRTWEGGIGDRMKDFGNGRGVKLHTAYDDMPTRPTIIYDGYCDLCFPSQSAPLLGSGTLWRLSPQSEIRTAPELDTDKNPLYGLAFTSCSGCNGP